MAKHSRKVTLAMARRAKTHTGLGPNQQNKHHGRRPGSQNRKKCGFGKGGAR